MSCLRILKCDGKSLCRVISENLMAKSMPCEFGKSDGKSLCRVNFKTRWQKLCRVISEKPDGKIYAV
jgi:hypothetical protein